MTAEQFKQAIEDDTLPDDAWELDAHKFFEEQETILINEYDDISQFIKNMCDDTSQYTKHSNDDLLFHIATLNLTGVF